MQEEKRVFESSDECGHSHQQRQASRSWIRSKSMRDTGARPSPVHGILMTPGVVHRRYAIMCSGAGMPVTGHVLGEAAMPVVEHECGGGQDLREGSVC